VRLPGRAIFPDKLQLLLEQELVEGWWEEIDYLVKGDAKLSAELAYVGQQAQPHEKFAALINSDLLEIELFVPLLNAEVSLGTLLLSFLEYVLHRNARSVVASISAHEAQACRVLCHLYTQIGHTLYVDGPDRYWLADVLEYSAQCIEPLCRNEEFVRCVAQVKELLVERDDSPVLFSHSRSPNRILCWQEHWRADGEEMKQTVEILARFAPAFKNDLDAHSVATPVFRKHVDPRYFTELLSTLQPEQRFLACYEIMKSFGNALRLGPKNDGAFFVVDEYERVADEQIMRSTLTHMRTQRLQHATT
jgi:hypothetical protein